MILMNKSVVSFFIFENDFVTTKSMLAKIYPNSPKLKPTQIRPYNRISIKNEASKAVTVLGASFFMPIYKK